MGEDRRSPLAAWKDQLAKAEVHSGGRLRLSELAFVSQVDVRVQAEVVSTVSEALGVVLPTKPNTVASSGDVAVLWLGPDEWLVVGPPGGANGVEAGVRAALNGRPGSVVDVSAQRTTLVVRGPAARDVLAHGCALNLHPDEFGTGRCAQTMMARAQVVLWHVKEDEFRMLVRASYAGYLAAWLLDAAAEQLACP
jgi:sarcosine oxidase subunit gamma